MAKIKVAIACQGGGVHGAFEVGVLTRILQAYQNNEFPGEGIELVGFSGTSAGALCALMVWYGLAPKLGRPGSGSVNEAVNGLNQFWDNFAATTAGDNLLNSITSNVLVAEEREIWPPGVSVPAFRLNPYGLLYDVISASLPHFGVRRRYFDLEYLLNQSCPALAADRIDWNNVNTRLLIGASEVVNGFETVFDSDINKGRRPENPGMQLNPVNPLAAGYWRQQLPLSLSGVAASGTLPTLREAEDIGDGYYWDGLYSQNPPVREFLAGVPLAERPNELWILRINPQQSPGRPTSNAEISDRQNELMGNLSLNKELDFILQVNTWKDKYPQMQYQKVTVRTIKMKKETAYSLKYSSKFNRSHAFINELRGEGTQVAGEWLANWPNNGEYPEDAAYP